MKLSISYVAKVSGTDANGEAWSVESRLDVIEPIDWARLYAAAIDGAFKTLTNGRAVYGKPGVSCRGPYRIAALHIEPDRPARSGDAESAPDDNKPASRFARARDWPNELPPGLTIEMASEAAAIVQDWLENSDLVAGDLACELYDYYRVTCFSQTRG